MVKTCCALNCRNKSKKPGISFFCFPKAPQLRREWIRRVNKANFQPTRHSVLCSEHFPSDSFLNESVPEFLQLIGLEQRPVRRRLRHGAVPTIFKLTSMGWEEGIGERVKTDDKMKEDEDMKEDGDDIEDETDEEDRFIIQMDVAEEDKDYDPDQEDPPSSPNSTFDQHGDDSSLESRVQHPNDDETGRDRDNPNNTSVIDNTNSRSTRPRRSCRKRDFSSEESKQDSCLLFGENEITGKTSSSNSDEGAANAGRKLTVKTEAGAEQTVPTNGEAATEGKQNCESNGDQGIEQQLFTIESVRSINNHDEMDEEGRTRSDGQCASHTSSPPTKKRQTSWNETSVVSADEKPRAILPHPKPNSSEPVLCRIDPAFCKFQSVFQVPFASSPTFFNNTADTMVVNKAVESTSNNATANEVAGSNHYKTNPTEIALSQNGVVPSSVCSIATAKNTSTLPYPVCMLPCCSGKASTKCVPTKPVRIKQESIEADEYPRNELKPAQSPILNDLRPIAAMPRLNPTEVPYRSDPINIPRTLESRSAIPYRSEPIRTHHKSTLPRSAPLHLRDTVNRNLTTDLSCQNLERTPRNKIYINRLPLESPITDQGDNVKEKTGKASSSRTILARQLLNAKSAPTFVTNAMQPAPVTLEPMPVQRLMPFNKSPPPLSKSSVIEVGGTQNGSGDLSRGLGPFFLRHDHVLADLLDVFKHSADRIQPSSVFRLCRNVTAANATSGGGTTTNSDVPAAATSMRDNWEDISPKKLFSLFWKDCMQVYFDGDEQKVPRIDGQNASSEVPYLLGKILRQGMVLCGYWPVALSPACAVGVFTGEKCSPQLFLQSLCKTLFVYESRALQDLRESARSDVERFNQVRQEQRVSLVAQTYGGAHCQVPTKPDEVEAFVVELAAYYLYCQPFWWLREMRRGLLSVTEHTSRDQNYLSSMTESEVVNMYLTLEPTPQALLQRTIFRMEGGKHGGQSRVQEYMERCLLRLSHHELVCLIERWSHADCLLDDAYYVAFCSVASGSSRSRSPPYFRPNKNTLVLSHPIPSFHLFQVMFKKMLNESATP